MTIKEVSEKFNISQDTLRYYEKVGMIPPVARTSGGIRNYREEDINWVKFAMCMRKAGLQVEAIVKYLKLFQEGDSTVTERLELLKEQQERLLEQKKKIDGALSKIEEKISKYEKMFNI